MAHVIDAPDCIAFWQPYFERIRAVKQDPPAPPSQYLQNYLRADDKLRPLGFYNISIRQRDGKVVILSYLPSTPSERVIGEGATFDEALQDAPGALHRD